MLAAIDLPGHGASAGVPSERIADYADTLKELIKGYGFPRPRLLVGHSMGGNIALQTALDHPGLVDGLVLIGSGSRMPVNPKMLEHLSKGTFDTSFLKIAYSPDAPAELLQSEMELWGRASQQQLFIDFTACNNFDASENLSSLNLPVLILVGDQDKMAPVKSSQSLHQNIAGSELRIIPGAGHHLMLEKPGETDRAIQEFLDKNFP